MSDMIFREAAMAALTDVAVKFGITGEPQIMIVAKDKLRALPAYEVGVKPLEWDASGWARDEITGDIVHYSDHEKQRKYDAERAARIRSALTATPAQDVVGLVDALDKTTAHGQRVDFSRVGHSLSDASWHVHLAGFRSRDDAGAFLSAALARMKGAGE